MKRFVLFITVLLTAAWPAAAELPPEILADQYLLEAKKAMALADSTTTANTRMKARYRQQTIETLQKIEALNVEPPLEYWLLYGKVLFEGEISTYEEVIKGKSLLQQYVIRAGRDAEHYTPTLESLSDAPEKIRQAQFRDLISAAEENDVEAIKNLIAAGADPNTVGKTGGTRVVGNIVSGRIRDEIYDEINTPLIEAAKAGHVEAIKALIFAGADPDTGRYIFTPLNAAAFAGQVDAIKALISAGADPNKRIPLSEAARAGQIEAIKVLIAAGVDSRSYIPAISTAAIAGQIEAIKALRAERWPTPVSLANRSVELLWITFPNDEELSDSARAEAIKAFIAAGMDPNVRYFNYTPLLSVSETGRIQSIKALIAGGADPNMRDFGHPLWAAANAGHVDAVKALLAGGADPNAIRLLHSICSWRRYAHHFKRNRTALVKALIAGGADINAKDKDGDRPRRVALEHGNYELATILKAAGAKK